MKNSFFILVLLVISTTSVYAERDLNRLLKGSYAQNEQWGCSASNPPFQVGCPDCWSEQITAAGVITYNGDGTAQGEGRGSYTNHHGNPNPGGDIFTYTCNWTYTVNPDRTFMTEGTCDIQSIFGGPPGIGMNQKWYGHIGKGKRTLLVERHDGEIEGISLDGITNVIDRVCGKTGTQIKIRKHN